ncbi:hypothetical protein QR680_014068 [Steinernema hermaphroditum]|uniref:Uncharacterized protein n=1 Tax=Steinernema hermaphroditum TaxID=289476 RepID=A0AA39M2K6_9BILA|nr:hypothetical protein QR680_014068 [Steinernema hermaphroditum]
MSGEQEQPVAVGQAPNREEPTVTVRHDDPDFIDFDRIRNQLADVAWRLGQTDDDDYKRRILAELGGNEQLMKVLHPQSFDLPEQMLPEPGNPMDMAARMLQLAERSPIQQAADLIASRRARLNTNVTDAVWRLRRAKDPEEKERICADIRQDPELYKALMCIRRGKARPICASRSLRSPCFIPYPFVPPPPIEDGDEEEPCMSGSQPSTSRL